MRCLDRFKSGRVALIMVLANLIGLAGLFAYYWDLREDRLEAEARAEATRGKIHDWMIAELYAPTEIEVSIGPTMDETRIVERPVFEGPRVRQPFAATWVVKLRSVDSDSLICTMPPTGPRWNSYQPDGPMRLTMPWSAYTRDDGTCFAQMYPGGVYDLITLRQAETVIDGVAVKRMLPSVRSKPFTFPGVP